MNIDDALFLVIIFGFPALFFSHLVVHISMEEHLIGKIFRRGKGIPDKEFKSLGCLRGYLQLFLTARVLIDSRINDAQRLIFIEEVYQEKATCLQGDQLEHDRRKNDIVSKAVLSNRIFTPKYSKRLTPEMLYLIIKELPPYKLNNLSVAWVTEDKYASGSSDIENIKLFLTNPRITKEAFKETFDKLLLHMDNALQLIKGRELSNESVNLITTILNTPRFSPEEVSLLCYSNMDWLRQIVIKNPKCSAEGKVVAALMTSSIKD